jgi:hypothetical protein
MKVSEDDPNALVTGVFPQRIHIDVASIADFRLAGERLAVGSYLRVSDSDECAIIAVVENFSIQQAEGGQGRTYRIEAVPIGFLGSDGKFVRGGNHIAIPPTGVKPAGKADVEAIFSRVDSSKAFSFAALAQEKAVRVVVDGDRLFNRHVAVVGSTGCGKSCAVASVVQAAVKAREAGFEGLNNAHVVVFDLHGEYRTAFPTANSLGIENLLLPYWLMNGEELEELLVETGENQAYNQANLLRRIVTRNKQITSGNPRVLFDSPVKFSIREVLNCISNLSRETRDAKDPSKMMIKGAPRIFVSDEERFDHYRLAELDFEETKAQSVNKGTFNDGSLEKFISRIRWRLADERLTFLLGANAENLSFEEALRSILGFRPSAEANVTVVDLSAVPFESLSITVSLMSRMLFEFGYYQKRVLGPGARRAPIFLVYEEAHRYVPKAAGARYAASRTAIERIAKEGRKYGVTLALVTQRPSEISETIFSQCSNVIAMRLTNPEDQSYVRRLLPDSLGPLTETLPSLGAGEALLIGDAAVMPALVSIDRASPEPSSDDVKYLQEWKKPWLHLDFGPVLGEWKGKP